MKNKVSKYFDYDKYAIIGTDIIDNKNEVIKTYDNFKKAMWDLDFYGLMYKDVKIYKLIVKNGEAIDE